MRIGQLLVGMLCCVTATMAQEPKAMVNAIGMEFIAVPSGSFTLGSYQPVSTKYGFIEKYLKEGVIPDIPVLSDSEYKRADSIFQRESQPGFRVTLSKPFYIGKFEVTQGQWKKVMGSNPSFFQGSRVPDNPDQHPVENVSWGDAQAFVKKLNKMEKGNVRYRLPTEFEWEYAARAGQEGDIPWDDIQRMAQIALTSTQEVGKKTPNAWGLYDMLGNVWEWTEDFYNEKMFADPIPTKRGKQHVLKGAPFYGDVKNATYMTHAGGPGSGYDVGFRIVAEVK